jgi:hypothetical protein
MTALQVLRYMVHGWEYSLRQQARLRPVIPVVVYHGAAPWTVATNFQALFDLPAALGVYVPEFEYLLTDLSTYSDEEIKRTAELGVGLLVLKHIFRPDLRARLPEVMSLWYTMRQQEHALRYLEAMIRYVTAAGQHVKAEDVRAALGAVTPEGDAMIGTIAQEWIQQGSNAASNAGCNAVNSAANSAGLRQGLALRHSAGAEAQVWAGWRRAHDRDCADRRCGAAPDYRRRY